MATSKLADNGRAQGARDWQLVTGCYLSPAARRLHVGDPSIGFCGLRIWMANRAGSKIATGFFGGPLGESSVLVCSDAEKVQKSRLAVPPDGRFPAKSVH
jgi:hypothetical protein